MKVFGYDFKPVAEVAWIAFAAGVAALAAVVGNTSGVAEIDGAWFAVTAGVVARAAGGAVLGWLVTKL